MIDCCRDEEGASNVTENSSHVMGTRASGGLFQVSKYVVRMAAQMHDEQPATTTQSDTNETSTKKK
jgi:hypothetical protein